MLDFLRRSATSFFAWIILGVLALVFGLSFGLPSQSLTFGPEALVKVDGHPIGEEEYRYQMLMMNNFADIPEDPRMQQLMGVREEVLDAAVERDLLAEVASEVGLAATTKDAEDLVVAGHVIAFHDTKEWLGELPFNYDIFKIFLRNLQISEQKYLEIQRREVLARTLRDLVGSSVVVAEGELRSLYDERYNQLSIRYARYPAEEFADFVDPTPTEIDAWVASHSDELEAQFAAQGTRFTKLPKQAHLWVIELETPADAEGANRGEAIAALRRQISGGTDFREVARAHSDHETARAGGDYGWVSEGSGTGLDPLIDEALGQLEVGELSEVIPGESGVYLVRVSERREGDVAQPDALRELAAEAIKADRAPALAKRAADEDQAAVAAGKPLAEVFEIPGGGLEQAGVEGDGSAAAPQARARRFRAELRETGLFSRNDPVPGIGPAPRLTAAAWAATPDTALLAEVFEVGTGFALAGLEEKKEATDAGYAEAREELYRELVRSKGGRVGARFAHRSCLEAKGRGDISPNDERIAREMTYQTKQDDANPPLQLKPYTVCDRVGNGGGLARLGGFLQGGGAG